jgi:hypothetical protein
MLRIFGCMCDEFKRKDYEPRDRVRVRLLVILKADVRITDSVH